MPHDPNKSAASQESTRSTLQPKSSPKAQAHPQPQPQPQKSPDTSIAQNDAVTALSRTTASTIRQAASMTSMVADMAGEQRSIITDHEAARLATILDPQSIQAEICAKTLMLLEGKQMLPFEVEPIELVPIPEYSLSLPASFSAGQRQLLGTSSDLTSPESPSIEARRIPKS